MTTERERRERARREFMREEAKRTTGVLLAVGYFCLFRALFVSVSLSLLVFPVAATAEGACAPDLLVVSAPETTAPDYAARFVDISAPIKQGAQTDPPICAPNVSYTNHSSPAPPELAALFPGLRLGDLPGGDQGLPANFLRRFGGSADGAQNPVALCLEQGRKSTAHHTG